MELDCDKEPECSSKMNQKEESYITNMNRALKDMISMDVSICTSLSFCHFLYFISPFQLHFVFESCEISCHQSVVVPRSPFLMDLMATMRCGAGVQSVNIHLAGVEADTCQRLVDYLYTGTCRVNTIEHVKEMIQLKNILQLNIDIEKRIYPSPNPALTDENNSSVANRDQNDDLFQTEESEELYVRQTKSSFESGSSVVGRLIQNITGDSEEDVEVLLKSFSENSEDTQPQAAVQEDEDIKNVHEDENDSESDRSSDSSSDDESNESSDDDSDDEGGKGDISVALVKPLKIRFARNSKGETGWATPGRQATVPSPVEQVTIEADVDSGFSLDVDDCDGDDVIPTIPLSLKPLLVYDEKRINESIASFLGGGAISGECSECGHSLTSDNYVLHYGLHLEEIQKAKKNLGEEEKMKAEEELKFEIEKGEELDAPDTSSVTYEEPTPPSTPPLQDPKSASKSSSREESSPVKQHDQEFLKPEDTVEFRINNLQEKQKKLGNDIVVFMKQFQRGAQTLECPECYETLIGSTSVRHFRSHINDLNTEIEALMLNKRDNKRSRSQSKDMSVRKKMRETTPKIPVPESRPAGGSIASEVQSKSRVGTEEERKKMYKRIYGRKKYQYRIQNRVDEVWVSEEEIDAEIKKEEAKYAGTGAASTSGSSSGLTTGEQLRHYVEHNSQEYKKEFKKARDRLYKRKLRELRNKGIMNNDAAMNIPNADIEVEMLVRYTANSTVNVKTEMETDVKEPKTETPLHEVRVKVETSILSDDLGLNLDDLNMGELFGDTENMGDLFADTENMGDLFADAESPIGNLKMEDIVSAVSGIDLPDTIMDTSTTESTTNDEKDLSGSSEGSTAEEGNKETRDETKPRLSRGYRIPKKVRK